MNGTTHMLGGAILALAVAPLMPPTAVPVLLVASALVGPLADIDHPGSMYGRYLPGGVAKVRGQVVRYTWKLRQEHKFLPLGRSVLGLGVLWHRGPLHSILAMLFTTLLATLVTVTVAPHYAVAIGLGTLIGYASHLLLDALNPTGEMLLYPWSRRLVGLKRWRQIRVGSLGETVIAVAMVGGLLILWR